MHAYWKLHLVVHEVLLSAPMVVQNCRFISSRLKHKYVEVLCHLRAPMLTCLCCRKCSEIFHTSKVPSCLCLDSNCSCLNCILYEGNWCAVSFQR